MAGKTKRPRRTPLPPITTRTRPWGATKQAADCFEKIRTLKNRIVELEKGTAVATGTEDTSWHPTGTEIEALRKVVMMSVIVAREANIGNDVATLTELYLRLRNWNGKRTLAAARAIQDHAQGPQIGDVIFVRPPGAEKKDKRWLEAKVTQRMDLWFGATVGRGPYHSARVQGQIQGEGVTWRWP